MPSIVLGQPRASGAQLIVSGNPWSGNAPAPPIGGVQLLWVSSGGNAYIGLSGGITINSGAMALSGGANSGMLDGMLLPPGGGYFIPKMACGLSGNLQLYGWCDQAASGIGRLYFEVF